MPFRRRMMTSLLSLSLLAVAGPSIANDEWDQAGVRDNTAATTRNELKAGVWQTHDLQSTLAAADEDWYVLKVTPFRSYEVVVGQVTGDTPIGNADFLELYDATGTTLLATAAGGAGSTEKFLRFNSAAASELRVRVKGSIGSGGATMHTTYAISYHESTMYCPRFNNAGSQLSVLLVQNTTAGACTVDVGFYDESGASLATFSGSASASGMIVLPVSSIPALVGAKGSVQIDATSCSPTALKAKLSALEPSTGFSFDTLCARR